jgi:hypothetical protein
MFCSSLVMFKVTKPLQSITFNKINDRNNSYNTMDFSIHKIRPKMA